MKSNVATTSVNPWIGKRVDCIYCGRAIKLSDDDKVKFIPDSIDGNYYQVECHACKKVIEVPASTS